MNEEQKGIKLYKKCLHPRVKEVLEEIAPPSPMVVPRDKSQPRAGCLLSIHKDHFDELLPAQIVQGGKPEVTLSLASVLLRRRKER